MLGNIGEVTCNLTMLYRATIGNCDQLLVVEINESLKLLPAENYCERFHYFINDPYQQRYFSVIDHLVNHMLFEVECGRQSFKLQDSIQEKWVVEAGSQNIKYTDLLISALQKQLIPVELGENIHRILKKYQNPKPQQQQNVAMVQQPQQSPIRKQAVDLEKAPAEDSDVSDAPEQQLDWVLVNDDQDEIV